MSGAKFVVDPDAEEGFYVTVGDEVTVYEEYDDAVTEIDEKIGEDTDSFLAEVAIENGDEDDVAVTLEQVGWQQVIRDMTTEG
jgi:hypothetical protein